MKPQGLGDRQVVGYITSPIKGFADLTNLLVGERLGRADWSQHCSTYERRVEGTWTELFMVITSSHHLPVVAAHTGDRFTTTVAHFEKHNIDLEDEVGVSLYTVR